ncbi:MarR family transcriptional regulator [Streptomyces sp. NPDC126522]|uniref:MarR family winged helix-turn-helix transcriptional regulator n=1 Tax=Streptomyces sp. NPDC126522 TaxID=3155211 RepID=UPI00332A704A
MSAKPADFTSAVQGVISPLIPTLARAHRAMSQELLRDTGLSAGQELIVMRLADSPPQSQAELTRWLGVEPPTTAKMLARMEKAGIVERVPSETDRRVTLVSLTAEGRAIYERVQNIWGDLERVTVAGLTLAEVQQLERLVRHMLSNLQNSQETPAPCQESV